MPQKNGNHPPSSSDASGPNGSVAPVSLGLRKAASSWDLLELDGSRLIGPISTILSLGGFVGFGTARESGALSLLITLPQGSETLYSTSNEDLEENLRILTHFLTTLM